MSDQDFFFDEDEQPAKSSAKASASTKTSKAAQSAASSGGSGQSVSMTVTALVGVIAALLGMIIGIFVGQGMAGPATPGVNAGAPVPQQAAPQLTPEQLQGGELPQGHPEIGSGGAPSAETTGQ